MMVCVGVLFQDGFAGSAWGERAFYIASPLHAFDPSAQFVVHMLQSASGILLVDDDDGIFNNKIL